MLISRFGLKSAPRHWRGRKWHVRSRTCSCHPRLRIAPLKPLVEALEAEGFTVWWDAQIGGGTNWHEDIEQHLDAAKCVLVAWSKRSVGHERPFLQFRDEARRAQRRDVYVPVCLDPVDPPLGFGEIRRCPSRAGRVIAATQGSKLSQKYGMRSRITGEPVEHPHFDFREPQVSRRAALAGGAVAAVKLRESGPGNCCGLSESFPRVLRAAVRKPQSQIQHRRLLPTASPMRFEVLWAAWAG